MALSMFERSPGGGHKRLAHAAVTLMAIGFALSPTFQVGSAWATPACTPKNLTNESVLDLSAYRGKVVYVDFWASWCAPCKMAFPFMNELAADYDPEAFTIVGISVDDSREKALKFAERTPASFTLGLDTTGTCPNAFGVKAMPSSFLLGPDGTVLYEHKGFRQGDEVELRAAIDKALAGGQP